MLNNISNLKSWQAWQLLSSLQLSSRNYSKPGKTLPLSKDMNAFSSQSSRRTTQQCLSGFKSTAASHNQNCQSFSNGDERTGDSNNRLSSSFPLNTFEAKESRNSWTSDTLQRQTINCAAGKSAVHTNARNVPSSFHDGVDDDDILEVIH